MEISTSTKSSQYVSQQTIDEFKNNEKEQEMNKNIIASTKDSVTISEEAFSLNDTYLSQDSGGDGNGEKPDRD